MQIFSRFLLKTHQLLNGLIGDLFLSSWSIALFSGNYPNFFQGVANHLNVRYEPSVLNVQLFKCNVVLNQNFDDTNLKKLKIIINSVLHPFACVREH